MEEKNMETYIRCENIDQLEQAIGCLPIAEKHPAGWYNGESWVPDVQYTKQGNTLRHFAILTEGNRVSYVSDRYTLIQHSDAFRPIIDALDGMHVSGRVNHFSNGKANVRVIFDDVTFTPEDNKPISFGLEFWNGHDRYTGWNGTFFGMRQTCSNGATISREIAKAFNIRHIGDLKTVKAKAVSDFFESMMDNAIPVILESYNRLCQNTIEYEAGMKAIDSLVLAKKANDWIKKEAVQEWNNAGTDKMTHYNIYNAITNFATHGIKEGRVSAEKKYHLLAHKVLNGLGAIPV